MCASRRLLLLCNPGRLSPTRATRLGQTTKLTAYNGSSTAKQETIYLFEDDVNASLVTNTIYPDSSDTTSSGSDQVKVTYHLDGSINTRTDQRGVVLTYTYDNARRTTLQAATGIPASVDDRVEAIGRTYDSLGKIGDILLFLYRQCAASGGIAPLLPANFSGSTSFGQCYTGGCRWGCFFLKRRGAEFAEGTIAQLLSAPSAPLRFYPPLPETATRKFFC